MSIIVLLGPALAPGESFHCPSGNSYTSDTLGLIRNVAQVDLDFLMGLGCRVAAPRDNKSASGAPTTANDYTQLYDVGSIWINTSVSPATAYICTTGFPAGAANWVLLGVGPQGPTGPTGPAGPAGGLSGTILAISGAYGIANADKGKTIYATNTDATISIGAASGYDANFQIQIYNNSSGNAPLISVSGLSSFRLMPQQTVVINNNAGSNWFLNPTTQRYQLPPGTGLNVYVDSTVGSDSNSGLNTSGKLATIAAAITLIKSCIHSATSGPQINLANSMTYNVGAGVNINYTLDGGVEFFIVGNTGVTLPNVVVNCSAGGACFNIREPATVTLEGIQYTTSGNGSVAVNVSQFATSDLEGGFAVGNFPLGTHFSCAQQGSMNFLSNYEAYSNAVTHLQCSHSYVEYGSFTCTLPNPLTFTTWVVVDANGYVDAGGIAENFTGPGSGASSTGQKYLVSASSTLDLSGGTFPGATAGAFNTNGIVR